jgi:hypothetical protein
LKTRLPDDDNVASPPIVTPVAVLPALPIHILATVSDGNAVEEIVVDPLVTRPFASVTTETYEPAVPTLFNTTLPLEDIVASPPIVTPTCVLDVFPTHKFATFRAGMSEVASELFPLVTRPFESVFTL